MTLRQVGTLVLALSLVVCAPAYAGNGNGNGKDDGNGNGSSATAPGQVKKEAAADAAAQVAPAQAQVQEAAPAPAAAETGVKPSNDTDKDTHEPAASDKTKEYGNGKTAGQIAMQNGAAPSTSLHGPGNSQPHKASPCAGGHEVDVHAFKGKRGGSCGSTPTVPTPTPTPTPKPHPTPGADPGPGPKQVVPSSSTPTPSSSSTPTVVVGSVAPKPKPVTGHSPGKSHKGNAAILGATGAVAGATLPFTGLDLWSAVFIGAMLILIGLALCRRAATLPVYKSEQEARP